MEYSENVVRGKEIVTETPSECFIPYKRSKWGRDDVSFKVPTSELEKMASFAIDLEG